MSDVQEFRDRCARAMGWFPATAGSYKHYRNDDSQVVMDMSDWQPDEDFNQAVMMRDAIPAYARNKYIDALLKPKRLSFGRATAQKTRLVAFATARQVAEAALQVLEAKDSGGRL